MSVLQPSRYTWVQKIALGFLGTALLSLCRERAKDALLQLASAIHLISSRSPFVIAVSVNHLYFQAGAPCSNMKYRLDVHNLNSAEM